MATAENLSNPFWRLNNLYYIKDKQGKKRLFKLNWAQMALYSSMWYLNIILKARQLGMTTLIQIFMLDRCLFNSNVNAGVVAHNQVDARKFFKDKIKFAYDNLPEQLRAAVPATNDSAGELSFANGSSIRVGTSLRSGTYQYLHISELGKLCAKYPDRAQEVITGALNTVTAGQFVFIESTAEGAYGHFFDMCKDAEERCNSSAELTLMDYKFWFFPWWKHPDYMLDADVKPSPAQEKYFDELLQQGIELNESQKAWYIKKEQEQRSKMKQEYPSSPTEAFEQLSEYAVYGEQIGEVIAGGRLCSLPVNPNRPVDLFFDLGKSTKTETTCVWFMQDNDPWYDFIDYYQAALKVVGGYVRDIEVVAKDRGFTIGRWFLPHDGDSHKDYDIETFKTRLVSAGVDESKIITVPVVSDLRVGIDQMKEKFPRCRFDKDRTKKGWLALCSYRYEWDEKRSMMGAPIHNWASHPSDSIRQFAQGYFPAMKNEWKPLKYAKAGIV